MRLNIRKMKSINAKDGEILKRLSHNHYEYVKKQSK